MADRGSRSSFGDWRRALQQLTESQDASREWRQDRYRFAHRLGQVLVGADEQGGPSMSGPVVYGVWLKWGLLYVGQTGEAERRLRDLAVGESHHLANTFPPEIWHRVVVVAWPQLAEATSLLSLLDRRTIGLALEHRLQAWLEPLANASRRTSGGGWAEVDWGSSRSVGARVGREADELFAAVQDVWQEAAQLQATHDVSSGICRVVFPELHV